MKLALASDIHLEMANQRSLVLPPDIDVLVLAGDIHKGTQAITWAAQLLRDGLTIIQVAGNHEHWKGEYHRTLDRMREEARKHDGLHFLENNYVDVDGWRFVGATAWTSFTLGGSVFLNQQQAQMAMNDYREIKWFTGSTWRKLLPRDIVPMNSRSRDFIFGAIADRQKTIVVTHHAPTELSVAAHFRGEALNHCYANEWANDILDRGPRYWLHGHMHDPVDYELGDTRVVANPIGYPGQYADTTYRIFDV